MQWLTRSYPLARMQVLVRACARLARLPRLPQFLKQLSHFILLALLTSSYASALESSAIPSVSSSITASASAVVASASSGPNIASATNSVSHPPAIPFKHDNSVASSALGGGAVGVLLISAVAIIGVMWARKKLNLINPQNAQGTLLRIVESQRLGPRAVLSVVEFDGGRYLIAQSEHGVQCLAGPNAKLLSPLSPIATAQEHSQ